MIHRSFTNHDKLVGRVRVFGNEIQVSFRWPPTSRMQYYKGRIKPTWKLKRRHCYIQISWSFGLHSGWSVSNKWIQPTAQEPVPYILKYEIPNGPEDKTLAFIRVTILSASRVRNQVNLLGSTVPNIGAGSSWLNHAKENEPVWPWDHKTHRTSGWREEPLPDAATDDQPTDNDRSGCSPTADDAGADAGGTIMILRQV